MKGFTLITKKRIFAVIVVCCLLLLVTYTFKREPTISPSGKTFTILGNTKKLNSQEDSEGLQKLFPNFPIQSYYNSPKFPKGINSTCGRFPQLSDIEFNNNYWQTLHTSNGTFQLFGAYWDARRKGRTPIIRILAMVNRIELSTKIYCQMWFENDSYVVQELAWYYYMWNKSWGGYKQEIYQPYLISCAAPEQFKDKPPVSVSLIETGCENATNNLRVIYNPRQKKKDFAVCVKALDFDEDLSFRLSEWVELLHMLGADKIFFYEFSVHENMKKLLRHYEEYGLVEVTSISLPGGLPNTPILRSLFLSKNQAQKRHNEMIPYNDCFYKNIYEYRYIVLLDIDEIIMPKRGDWHDLMRKMPDGYSSYSARNVYFIDEFLHNHGWFDDIPNYMHMLQHVYRTKEFTKPGYYIKSFHDTENVLILHNHYPLLCFERCAKFSMQIEDAQLQHYRTDCVRELKSCSELKNDVIQDTTIWRFKSTLTERVTYTLRTLGFIE